MLRNFAIWLLFFAIAISIVFCKFDKTKFANVDFADPEIQEFSSLIDRHGFNLADSSEFNRRLDYFRNAKTKIETFQNKYKDAQFGHNKFSLMSDDEKKHYLNGAIIDPIQTRVKRNALNGIIDAKIPVSMDYRNYGKVTSVKDQKNCGSCWAFTSMAAIESQYLIKFNLSLDLSEQYIVNCNNGSHQCAGGSVSTTFKFVNAHGVPQEFDQPYTASNGNCTNKSNNRNYFISGYRTLGTNESTYAAQIYNYGPATMIFYVCEAFAHYKSGFLDIPSSECNKNNYLGKHFILIVGWTKDYWIAKNSWGKKWGDNGYVSFKRNQNFSGMTQQLLVPTI